MRRDIAEIRAMHLTEHELALAMDLHNSSAEALASPPPVKPTRARDDAQPSVSVVFDARRSREGVRFGPGAPRADHAGRCYQGARGRARHRHRLRRDAVFSKAAALFRRTEARAPCV